MGRAGFNLINVDVEDVKINYPSMWELMEDLRDMGESNAVLGRYVLCFSTCQRMLIVLDRRPFVKRDVLLAADAIYRGKSDDLLRECR
jgi:NADH dehydrogenase [ubiquinone] 1 alpha subcomplex assembly factor 5